MTRPVKRGVANRKKKRRNQRVTKDENVEMDEKVETKLPKALKTRFSNACKKRGASMSNIVRDLIIAWCEAVEKGDKPDAPFEVREKPPETKKS